ncbi:hypothetical protein [Candidatus Villigracilis vicinus]
MVRYRSRRDMLKMAVEIAGLGFDIHKWASLEDPGLSSEAHS